jgi:predicted ABC-type transport system involved in lysophospholipase L1 biosynthesis ATPase subunit
MTALVVAGVSLGAERGRDGWFQVLRGVSFDVDRGEVVGIVGARQSGKTVLLKIAAGRVRPDEGSVRLGDVELTKLRRRRLEDLRGRDLVWVQRAKMAQDLQARKIVGWPLARHRGKRAVEQRAAEMLERVGAEGCADKHWEELSPWEQVLVGLAQGFAGEPRVVLIDDLLDGLGSDQTREASDLMRRLIDDAGRSCGVVMSATDRDSVMLADRVWALENGKLIPTAGHHRRENVVVPMPRHREAGG